ncbi:hypothetical protein [Halorubrum aethiopicum]|uniref:hypothetical protein n=1 Tax=Halorubrum aethiopicum TaxID=1758255 RepID=UPI000833F86E|nr:hypothetical protein [Halorubrum aethiopicum]
MNGAEIGDDGGEWSDDLREEYRKAFVEASTEDIEKLRKVITNDESLEGSELVERYPVSGDDEEDGHSREELEHRTNMELEEYHGLSRDRIEEREDQFVRSLDLLEQGFEEVNGSNGGDEAVSIREAAYATQLCSQRLTMLRSSVAASVGTRLKNLFGWLKNVVSSISSKLWNLVSSHTSLQEWSVTGGAGVSMFGLQGNADVSLTFGP